MALSRQFLNLIVDNRIPGAISLRCIDLTRQHFFNTTTPPQAPKGIGSGSGGPEDATFWAPAADAGNQKNNQAGEAAPRMERIQLPSPLFNFQASRSDLNDKWKIDCFPLVDRRVICADQWGRSFLFEADTRRVVTMPRLHEPKSMPISLFVPRADVDGDIDLDGGGGGSLFVMERIPKSRSGNQFEAFVYCNPELTRFSKSWDCQVLPPPPYVHDAAYLDICPEIISYGVVNDGSEIFISVEGVGTYCLDTTNHTWREVGKWTLPFYGKVEYAPELKLWFGLSAKDQVLAAADLSSMDSQPQLIGACKELDPPEEWKQYKDSQLVNLGSGKFCIARFFHTRTRNGDSGDELIEQNFAVLTGVEVSRLHDVNGNANSSGSDGKVELKMTPHKSRCHTSNASGTIQAVF
uniref:DUF1618 domain-containing protein n=1 Tax=Arundo donax TaxID=35708 RepID=A0A0A9C4I5_ARUDO